MEISHYIITRFNIRIPSSLTRQLQTIDVTRDEEYLEDRFKLFFEYTVPSVLQQSDKGFVWILMFSANTPQQFKNRIATLERENPFIKTLYIADDENCNDILENYILERHKNIIVTSRLDNDDAIHRDYVKEIHTVILQQEIQEFALIFNNGCQYDETHKFLSKYHFPKNHFSTLVEVGNKDKIKTILRFNHMEIGNNVNTVELNNDIPMWLEVVHATNVSNRMHSKIGGCL